MNITVFAEKKIIFILNFSVFMSSNLGLFPQTPGFSAKDCDIHNRRPFWKMKIPKKWQIPLIAAEFFVFVYGCNMFDNE